MIWLLFFLILLLALLLWLPIVVEVDTQKQIFRVQWKGILALWGEPGSASWRWFIKLFFWKIELTGGNASKEYRVKSSKKKSTGSKRKMPVSWRQGIALSRNLVKAVSVNRLHVDWDTGDFVLNAWLYPICRMTSSGQRQLFINFSGNQVLAIQLQTRLGLMVIAVLRVFITTKK